MGTTIQRNLGPVSHLTKRQYTVETASGEPAICCPKCGEVSGIEFAVYRGGLVSQIWSCPCAACPFRDYLELEAWDEQVVPA